MNKEHPKLYVNVAAMQLL